MTNPHPTHTAWDGKPPRPFSIAIPQITLDDLRERLARARWPGRIPGGAWNYGTDIDYLQDLCAYWSDTYDWRRHEVELNAFRQFKVTIGGIDLHFIHEMGEGRSPKPLLLTHGWPGSFYEYHKLIPRLTHPARFGGSPSDAFTVVVPSMPGHGLSFTPDQPRFGLNEIAELPHRDVGGRLIACFEDAGLPTPRLIWESIAGGHESPLWRLMAMTYRSMLPQIAASPGPAPADVGDPATLADRLVAQAKAVRAQIVSKPQSCAWAIRP